ncbi:transcription factor bHLH57-like [Argentina anserina]|uniref:transcription factor bHLH57-like n=1 Tax=Argentina anserina TaxID=57926 RepID=UPI00217632E0|nr:transcription factor bHLH57-like [Potentilla anserina]
MERLQGPINPCFFGDHLDLQSFEHEFTTTNGLRFEEEEEAQYLSGLEDRIPFLQMLQSIDFPPCDFTQKETSFQSLLRLQHLKTNAAWPEMENTQSAQIQTLEALESCVTHDSQQQLYHSPAKSEGQEPHHNNPLSASGTLEGGGGVSSDCNQEMQQLNSAKMGPNQSQTQFTKSGSSPATRERRKRKRTRPTKNKEEVESQRMTHIAVERNRRRQMNDHLNVLKSLMPPSYIQRGDQASIVGGAIDFVKELEQHLQSLEAHKRMRRAEGFTTNNVDPNINNSMSSSSPSSSSAMTMPSNGMFMSLSQCRIGSTEEGNTYGDDGFTAQNKSEAAEVDVTVIQTHVNLKVQCYKRPGQLVRALVAFEDIRLTVLHLNITSSEDKVLYSFNLKIEEGCKLGSADDIARAVHQIFSFINCS